MKIIELDSSHHDIVRPLFFTKKFMGLDNQKNFFVPTGQLKFDQIYHAAYSTTYLSGLKNYKSMGLFDDNNQLQALIAFYMTPDEPSWYGTQIRSSNNKKWVPPLLDAVIDYNEKLGRLKFYTLWSKKHTRLLRKFAFSDYNIERYDYFDEYVVPAKTKCLYLNHWQVLFNRILLPGDTVVRCTFLKQKYRQRLTIGGNI